MWRLSWLWNNSWLLPRRLVSRKQRSPVVQQPPAPQSTAKHLGPGETWLPCVSPVSRHQITEREREREREKKGEIKRDSQMLHCRLMLITLVQGQEKKKKKAQGSRCGEEGTPRGKLLPRDGTERNNSSPHERCRRCVHCVWAKQSLWMSSVQPPSTHWIIKKRWGQIRGNQTSNVPFPKKQKNKTTIEQKC